MCAAPETSNLAWVRTDLLGMPRTRSRFTTLWEFTLFVVVLLVLFLVVVDLAVTRGDDRTLRTAAMKTAEAIVGSDDDADVGEADALSCEPVGLRAAGVSEGVTLPQDAVCLMQLGVAATHREVRVRLERADSEVTVCAMLRPRSVTGILSPVQKNRTLRTVATTSIDPADDSGIEGDGSSTVDRSWVATERALPGSDWSFCPAGRDADEPS